LAYATAEQLLDRYDPREIGDLVSEDENRVPERDLLNNSKLNRALEDASAQIRSAAFVAEKYSNVDLEGLAKAQDAFLVQITCDLAFGRLLTSRSLATEIVPDVERAQQWLALLRLGERIFPITANAQAGNATHGFITNQRRYEELRFIADVASPRYFPLRETRRVKAS